MKSSKTARSRVQPGDRVELLVGRKKDFTAIALYSKTEKECIKREDFSGDWGFFAWEHCDDGYFTITLTDWHTKVKKIRQSLSIEEMLTHKNKLVRELGVSLKQGVTNG